MFFRQIFDPELAQYAYLIGCQRTGDAIVIDPVLDYEPVGSRVWNESVERLVAFVQKHDLRLHLILETHAHADHMSGSQVLKRALPDARVAISRRR